MAESPTKGCLAFGEAIPQCLCVCKVRYNLNTDAMILFGGRDIQNNSLKDVFILKKEKNDYEWMQIQSTENDIVPIGRNQQCATVFGPFLIVVGGRASPSQATFDVFSFVSKK